jgi:hypothetical protein
MAKGIFKSLFERIKSKKMNGKQIGISMNTLIRDYNCRTMAESGHRVRYLLKEISEKETSKTHDNVGNEVMKSNPNNGSIKKF